MHAHMEMERFSPGPRSTTLGRSACARRLRSGSARSSAREAHPSAAASRDSDI